MLQFAAYGLCMQFLWPCVDFPVLSVCRGGNSKSNVDLRQTKASRETQEVDIESLKLEKGNRTDVRTMDSTNPESPGLRSQSLLWHTNELRSRAYIHLKY